MNMEMFLDKGWGKSITKRHALKEMLLKHRVSDQNLGLHKGMKSSSNRKCINRYKRHLCLSFLCLAVFFLNCLNFKKKIKSSVFTIKETKKAMPPKESHFH